MTSLSCIFSKIFILDRYHFINKEPSIFSYFYDSLKAVFGLFRYPILARRVIKVSGIDIILFCLFQSPLVFRLLHIQAAGAVVEKVRAMQSHPNVIQ